MFKKKMKYYLVAYAHEKGFGRKLFGTTGPVDENCIFNWENKIGWRPIIAISKIDGPVTPVEDV